MTQSHRHTHLTSLVIATLLVLYKYTEMTHSKNKLTMANITDS